MPPRLTLSSRPSIQEIAAAILNPSRSRPYAHRPLHRSVSVSSCTYTSQRSFSARPPLRNSSHPPKSRDRGPVSKETTQTDFSSLDVLGGTPAPSTAIDATLWDGFHLDNGVKIGDGAGVLLVNGEAFAWRPWDANTNLNQGNKRLVNAKGQFELPEQVFGILSLVYPKPDLLILGVGAKMVPLSPATRTAIAKLGIRVEVQDTRNASAQFNLLATERGVGTVAAGLVPIGWREGVGVVSNS